MTPRQETALHCGISALSMSALGQSRRSRHSGVFGSPQERTFGQCPRLWVHAL